MSAPPVFTALTDEKAPSGDPGTLRKHSMTIDGHQTSITVENAFWWRLRAIARAKNVSLNTLVGEIDHAREGTLSSAVRVFVLEYVCAHRHEEQGETK